jgi:hypothetical protein
MSGWIQKGGDICGEEIGDLYGGVVSLSANGNILAVGAIRNDGSDESIDSGHVRVYEWNGSSWVQIGDDIDGEAAGDESGYSISLNEDGTIIAIGANFNDDNGSSSGHVRVYERNGSSWDQIGTDISGEASGDQSGFSVSLNYTGNILAIGAPYNNLDNGHVRIYELSGDDWTQKGNDIDGEVNSESGYSVSLSSDGNIVAIGAPANDSITGVVKVYEFSGSDWEQIGENIDGEENGEFSGWSVSLSSDGTTLAVGSPALFEGGLGLARVYEYSGSDWEQKGGDIIGEEVGDIHGISVSLSSDGDTLAVGAAFSSENVLGNGQVRVYQYNGSVWEQKGEDIEGDALGETLGLSVSLSSDGNTVAIGAPFYTEDIFGGEATYGQAKVYEFISSNDNDNNNNNDNNNVISNSCTCNRLYSYNRLTEPTSITIETIKNSNIVTHFNNTNRPNFKSYADYLAYLKGTLKQR